MTAISAPESGDQQKYVDKIFSVAVCVLFLALIFPAQAQPPRSILYESCRCGLS
jgi:hypothetical protein